MRGVPDTSRVAAVRGNQTSSLLPEESLHRPPTEEDGGRVGIARGEFLEPQAAFAHHARRGGDAIDDTLHPDRVTRREAVEAAELEQTVNGRVPDIAVLWVA